MGSYFIWFVILTILGLDPNGIWNAWQTFLSGFGG